MSDNAKVYLVGAGPGDPELLTLKALRLIQQADVIVYDRLVSQEIITLIPTGTSRIYVGKQSGNHILSQQQINELLVQLAQDGRQVVRLKGGDPYTFGRGSEEAITLRAHAIDFEVVPGITAATACAAYAGIPLTHRSVARSVQFITGHLQQDNALAHDWSQLTDPQTTLVFYMGIANLAEICSQLIAAGRAPTTPAAVVENASTLQQRRVSSDLAMLPQAVEREGLASPALIIVGEVVKLAETLDWFSQITHEFSEEVCYAEGS